MSSAVNKSGIKRSMLSNNAEQNELFVDKGNINLTKRSTLEKVHETEETEHKHSRCNITPFVLMIALSMHALFEGIAFGLMKDFTSALQLMISILIHKFAEAMSISIALQKSDMEFKTLLKFIILFAFATPLGTSLGLILNEASEIVNIVFVSLAGGTFIYVSCSELTVEEFSLPGNRWFKLLSFILGAVLIGSLLLLDSD
jgi:solute carrier family 39 (zinc transporter), member 1/2/3